MQALRKKLALAALLASAPFAQNALAAGSALKFDTTIGSITTVDEDLTIVTILVQGFEVPLVIDGDTELQSGEHEIDLEQLAEGDRVKVEAEFEDGALVADEIALVTDALGQFAMRGEISDIEFAGSPTATSSVATTVTLLGVDVLVDDDTRIVARGMGLGNRVPAEELQVGDDVRVIGNYESGALWANLVIVGERAEGGIEIEGSVGELTADGFILVLRRGGQLQVVLDEDTEIDGEIEVGTEVRVEGLLNEELQVIASEVDAEKEDRGGRGRWQVSRSDDNPGRGIGSGDNPGRGNDNPGRGRGGRDDD